MSSKHDLDDPIFATHRGGKMAIESTVPLTTRADLSLAYTPGVAEVCLVIAEDPSLVEDYTWVSHVVAVVTDGSAVLGLGNIGPRAAMPVMEGKAVLFKAFGGIDAVPICLDTQDVEAIIEVVTALAPSFGGINLEDISAPRCFEIERRLDAALPIPVFHDDQHGTAIVVLAALRNAALVLDRKLPDLRVVVVGAGAAGVAVTKMLIAGGVTAGQVIVCDSKGALHAGRDAGRCEGRTRRDHERVPDHGGVEDALRGADVLIGVSGGSVVRGGGGRDGAGRDHLRAREPDTRGASGHRREVRGDRRNRPQRLPEPDQQRARVSRHLPRRPGRAGDHDHREHEDCRRRGDRRRGSSRSARGRDRAEPAGSAGGRRGGGRRRRSGST